MLVLATVAWLAAPRRPIPASEPWGSLGLDALALPAFAVIAGCAFAMAQHRGWTSGAKVAGRAALLVLLGLAITALAALVGGLAGGAAFAPELGTLGGLERVALTGPLAQLGVALAVLGVVGLLVRGFAGWALMTVLGTLLGSGALWLTTALCGGLGDTCNPAASLVAEVADAAGAPADPRITASVTTIVAGLGLALAAIAGATLVHALLRARSFTGAQRGRVVGWALLVALLLGVLAVVAHFTPTMWGQQALQPAVPLWTPPLALAAALLAALAAAVLHPAVDTDLRGGTTALGALAGPFAAVGRMSLLAVATMLALRSVLEALPSEPLRWFAALGDIPSIVVALVVVAAWLMLALRADRTGRRLRP